MYLYLTSVCIEPCFILGLLSSGTLDAMDLVCSMTRFSVRRSKQSFMRWLCVESDMFLGKRQFRTCLVSGNVREFKNPANIVIVHHDILNPPYPFHQKQFKRSYSLSSVLRTFGKAQSFGLSGSEEKKYHLTDTGIVSVTFFIMREKFV